MALGLRRGRETDMADDDTDTTLRQAIASARGEARIRDHLGRFAASEPVASGTPAESDEQRAAREFDAELRELARRPTRTSGRRLVSDLMPLPGRLKR